MRLFVLVDDWGTDCVIGDLVEVVTVEADAVSLQDEDEIEEEVEECKEAEESEGALPPEESKEDENFESNDDAENRVMYVVSSDPEVPSSSDHCEVKQVTEEAVLSDKDSNANSARSENSDCDLKGSEYKEGLEEVKEDVKSEEEKCDEGQVENFEECVKGEAQPDEERRPNSEEPLEEEHAVEEWSDNPSEEVSHCIGVPREDTVIFVC